MDASIAKILSRVYELEGLLHVADRADNSDPHLVVNLIKTKAEAVNELAQQLVPPATQAEADSGSEPAAPAAQEAVPPESDDDHLPSDDYDPEETWQHDQGEEPGEIFGSAYVEPEHIDETGDQEPEEPVADDGNEDEEPTPPAFTPENIDMHTLHNEEAEQDDTQETPDDDEEEPEDDEPEDDEYSEPVRLDEQLHRNLTKNMRKALSINDRYRFKRELFGNSELDLNDALDMVQSMKSYDEATEYFYDDLGWDKNNEEVQDFMNIVKRHFL